MMKTAIKGASAEINFYIVGRKKMPGLRIRSKHSDLNARIWIQTPIPDTNSGSRLQIWITLRVETLNPDQIIESGSKLRIRIQTRNPDPNSESGS